MPSLRSATATPAARGSPLMKGSALEKEQEQVQREKKQLNSDMSSELVEINIGGQLVLQVQHGTLCLFPDSTFSQIFNENFKDNSGNSKNNHWSNYGVSRDTEGRIFFDHDPSLIECIVNYLRLKRLHATSSSRSQSPSPPMPPPKPPEGKKEELDILLHSFGLTRSFYPNPENGSTDIECENETMEVTRKKKATTPDPRPRAEKIGERKKTATEGESLSVPNTITVSNEGKEDDSKAEACTGFHSNSSDGDDDDDAKTVPISIALTDGSAGFEEVQEEEEAGTKRAHRFEPNCLPVNKKMRRSNGNEARPTESIQKNNGKDTEKFASTSKNAKEKFDRSNLKQRLHAYLENVRSLEGSQPIRNEVPWEFLPGKPVDTCSHCPACGNVFHTVHDKLHYVPSKFLYAANDLVAIKTHEQLKKCGIWRSHYVANKTGGFDEDADFTFYWISKWNLVETDCLKLTVKEFSREKAIETMRCRFAVGRFRLGIRDHVIRRSLFQNESNLCKIKSRQKEYYSAENMRNILGKCLEILNEVEERCMAILHHGKFSDRVTKKEMVTKVINDLNLMTVDKSHAYRLMTEYEKQCGRMTAKQRVVSQDECQENRENDHNEKSQRAGFEKSQSENQKCNGDKTPKLSQKQLPVISSSSHEVVDDGSTNPLRLKASPKPALDQLAISLIDSESENDFPDSNIPRSLFQTQSPKKSSPNTRQVKSEERVYRYSSKERSWKSSQKAIDLLSSDSESDDGLAVPNKFAPRNTPLKKLQNILDRMKSKQGTILPAKRKNAIQTDNKAKASPGNENKKKRKTCDLCPLCARKLEVDIVGMLGKTDFVEMVAVNDHFETYKCPIWYKWLDRNVTEVTKESYVNIVLQTVTCEQADRRFTYMDDPEEQLTELKVKLTLTFQCATAMLSDNKISTHTKLYTTKKRTTRGSKVKDTPILTDKDRPGFLNEVQEKATSLEERINRILMHDGFPSILKGTNHKKIINSLNLALCTFKYSNLVLTDFEMRLNTPSAKQPSQWTYGAYNYNPSLK